MQIPLAGLLLLASPWIGSWRVSLEGSMEPMHLVVTDAKNVELYDGTWTPHEIKMLVLEEDSIQMRAMILESAQTLNMKAKRVEDKIAGSVTLNYPQFAIKNELKGFRVSKEPFPAPVDWIARHRVEGMIDVVSYLVRNAPCDSFEEFHKFWEEAVEPDFYIFLQAKLYNADGDAPGKEETLKRLFDSLKVYTKECVKEAMNCCGDSSGTLTRQLAGTGSEAADEANIASVVLLPAEFADRQVLKLSSVKNVFPPGTRPCCGESLYELEEFQLLPVSCSIEPDKASSKSNKNDAGTAEKSCQPEENEKP